MNTISPNSRRSMASGFTIEFDSIAPAEWTAELEQFGDSMIYQSYAYGQVCWGPSQLSHFVLRKGGEVRAMAQLRIVNLPLVRAGIAYLRWGPMVRAINGEWDADVFSAALLAIQREYAVRRGLLLRIIPNVYESDPYSAFASEALSALGFSKLASPDPYRTLRLDLSLPLDALRKGLGQRWRNKLKNAEAVGFTNTICTDDLSFNKFQNAYKQMMSRKRFDTTVDVAEFARIQSLLPESAKMKVLLCEKDGVLFNALIVAAAGDTGIYVLAATSDAGLQADGAFTLQWQAIQMLKAKGIRWYDLGGVNPEKNPGVYQFKSGIGGQDTRQIGAYEYCSNPLSSFSVRGGESLSRLMGRARRLVSPKRGTPASATRNPSAAAPTKHA